MWYFLPAWFLKLFWAAFAHISIVTILLSLNSIHHLQLWFKVFSSYLQRMHENRVKKDRIFFGISILLSFLLFTWVREKLIRLKIAQFWGPTGGGSQMTLVANKRIENTITLIFSRRAEQREGEWRKCMQIALKGAKAHKGWVAYCCFP